MTSSVRTSLFVSKFRLYANSYQRASSHFYELSWDGIIIPLLYLFPSTTDDHVSLFSTLNIIPVSRHYRHRDDVLSSVMSVLLVLLSTALSLVLLLVTFR
jgi:hypothetical protein